jgi:Protein of unknown function (DUF1761)
MHINWLAFAAAAVARVIIGMAWYSPIAFGPAFAKATGRSNAEIMAGLPLSIASDVIGALAMAFVLAHLVLFAYARTWLAGLEIGLFCWLGFIVVSQFGLVMYERRSLRLFLISTAQWGVVLAVMGAILGAWR